MIDLRVNSPLLTGAEVACYLRLSAPDDDADAVARAVRCVHKLVRDGKLRPVKPGREYVFALAELDRYVRDETENFEPQENAH
ncbi:MAG: helix-turn-helix domain-containing protein [Phycisphaerales bacterium]